MSDLFDRLAQLSPEKRALLARRLAETGTPVTGVPEPIAVIGLGCRFPGGADNPDAFWQLLERGVDAISEVPADRWSVDELFDANPAAAGKVASRWGGFLHGVDRFDPYFFGIAPREAARMDPQQRLWLEVAWEAFEDAGLTMQALAGSATGVFLGLHSHSCDYFWLQLADPSQMDAFTGPGTAHNIAAGRLAYLFDLRGPAVTVDTACSSSLVALHMACQSLRAGDCRIAIAGGVNLILSPLWSIPLSRMQFLSPTGRCRAFDAAADGFVRGEGAGAVVLKRLSDATRDGDPVLAVIRGSAVNQDGRTNGITAPNGLAQRALLRDALRVSGVQPQDITHVETHGTGTSLGDPIEFEALAEILGQGRPADGPCWLGAVKSNFGHLEGAAGIAGFIKVVLSLERGAVPPVVHFHALNPQIGADTRMFPVPTSVEPWAGEHRVAGVSSFGWSGTNAHVIVEQASRPTADTRTTGTGPFVLPLSARSPESLRSQVARYVEFLRGAGGDRAAADVCFTAALRRTHHEHRVVAVGGSTSELADALAAYEAGEQPWTVAGGRTRPGRAPSIAFVFCGQGPQSAGMGRELFEHDPVFRAAIERCDAIASTLADWSIVDALTAPADRSRLDRTAIAQPVLFALQVALVELWRSRGVRPSAVVGHSIGEIAAAWCAGAISLEDAAKIAVLRGALMDRAERPGRMLSVDLSRDEVRRAIEDWTGLGIAAINSPTSLVLSGDAEALEAVERRLSQQGVGTRFLPVKYAFHSHHMEAAAAELARALGSVPAQPARIPIASTVTGALSDGAEFNGTYWGRNVRQTVRFADAVDVLVRRDHPVFLEIGPHPVLRQSLTATAAAASGDGSETHVVHSLHRGRDSRASMLASFAALHAAGCSVDWKAVSAGDGRPVRLPAYAWDRERYWLDHVRPYSPAGRPPIATTTDEQARESCADGWLYEPVWQRDDRVPVLAAAASGAWLVLADRGGIGRMVASELGRRGNTCVVLEAGDTGTADDYEACSRAIREAAAHILSGSTPWRGVIHLWSLDATGGDVRQGSAIENQQTHGCGAMLTLAQLVARLDDRSAPALWIATSGVHDVAGEKGSLAVGQAPVWGLARTFAIEHPGVRCVRIDLPAGDAEAAAHALVSAVARDDDEDQVVYRDGARYVSRLRRLLPPAHALPFEVRGDATYLLTGGLGALGRRTAQWLVQRGARHLVLVGRSASEATADGFLQELAAAGAEASLVAADVSREADVARLFARIAGSGFPLKGIVHAAGIIQDGVLLQQDWARFRSVFQAKIAGAWNLHLASKALELDFFVLYSSLASLLGSAGQGNYAAANAFLDALARERRRQGLVATSVNWGAWGLSGMAAALDEAARRRLQESGIETMDPEAALEGLERALASGKPQVGVLALDWTRYRAARSVGSVFLSHIDDASPGAAKPRAPGLLELLEEAPAERKFTVLLQHVRANALSVLGVPSGHPLDNDQGLRDAGLDSLMALELKNRLQQSVNQPLPATLAFDFPTIAALAGFLADEVLKLRTSEPAAPAAAPSAAAPVDDLDALSDEEAAALLTEELSAIRQRPTRRGAANG